MQRSRLGWRWRPQGWAAIVAVCSSVMLGGGPLSGSDELVPAVEESIHRGRSMAGVVTRNHDGDDRSPARSGDFEPGDHGAFYTEKHPVIFFHNMAGFGIYPYTEELLAFLGRFENVWAGNVFPLPPSWVESLHTSPSGRTRIFFYELFPALHYIFGKDDPQPYEQWQTDFLDDHRADYFSINPLMPPDFQEYARGRHLPGTGLLDYFINYGRTGGGPEAVLIEQYHSVKRVQWGYDGIFFDLTGSAFLNVGEIEDPVHTGQFINAAGQYDALASTREDPEMDYDHWGAEFLKDLAARDPNRFPIWTNQAYRSGDPVTGENPYYRHIEADLDESTFTTWYNTTGWEAGVSVQIDGVWYEGTNPVETRIIPFREAVANTGTFRRQLEHARVVLDNPVQGIVVNYVRPYYRPIAGGYEAMVDREAIYYGYACGRVLDLWSFGWDFFDTFVSVTGVSGAPPSTGLPTQGYYRWAFDPIYFVALGGKGEEGGVTIVPASGGEAVFCGFEGGFILINSSSPAQDVTVDLTDHFPQEAEGIHGILDHFEGVNLDPKTRVFVVPAAHYPLGDVLTNSARIYSYVGPDGGPILLPAGGEADHLQIH